MHLSARCNKFTSIGGSWYFLWLLKIEKLPFNWFQFNPVLAFQEWKAGNSVNSPWSLVSFSRMFYWFVVALSFRHGFPWVIGYTTGWPQEVSWWCHSHGHISWRKNMEVLREILVIAWLRYEDFRWFSCGVVIVASAYQVLTLASSSGSPTDVWLSDGDL